MAAVSMQISDGVAVITVDNPPVNAISQAVRQGLMDAIAAANADERARRILLICAGRTFMAGADVSEFGKPPLKPDLPDVVAAIEGSEKPVVAAIHGQALGGGLEIALGCHYRIALQGSRLGLPEVNLGLVPGAGGTQRLPRLIGAEKALEMITSGKPVNADKAAALGLVDQVMAGELQAEALVYTQTVAATVPAERRLSSRPVKTVSGSLFDDWRKVKAKRQRGVQSVQACIDAVEAACTLSFEAGRQKEREMFLALRGSAQSVALQHIFFAERQAGKVAGLNGAELMPVQSVAVIGAGTMGTGIAMAFAQKGFDVTLLELSAEALARGMERICSLNAKSVQRGRMSADQSEAMQARIRTTTDYADLADVDMVVEAVFEDLGVKTKVFAQLQAVCKPDVILASNTSYLDMNKLAATMERPENVVGMHFFSPANIMKLVEVVKTDYCNPVVLKTVLGLLKTLGKVGVVSGVCHGFIGNRMYQSYQREAGLLLLEGATPAQVDRALYQFGMAMGPFAVADMSGIDISYMMRKALTPEQYDTRAFTVHDRLVESDRKGQKTGAGFYRYEGGEGAGVNDPEVLALIESVADELGFERREISDAEIIERCMLGLVNEGAHIVEEGIAGSASDIDVVYVNGYGFPRHLGGPMHYAKAMGIDNAAAKIASYAEVLGDRWWSQSDTLNQAAVQGHWD
ncbi:enoyl-CoA hydratase/isomerase family protein [Pontibacterium sp. N1Y112]|uniref:Enoyl-CoA hydratase/isomerase family protein n=1 Tax=Pontibacterium sinense TaxID=2781979 RepID=A0A8J7KB99_9GAMM|nr:3-hydroxyacyl-CoA dehydrogenase NAD-binding domain-containing protein [Pontibacterium sinense]MBE9398926.1 enoyl-CoA hydratase/isomerase family protein [Pontibacterium sinense]